MSNPDLVATIRYLVPGEEKPVYIASTGGADAALRIGAEFEERDVEIHDARLLQPPPDLDRQGFCLLPHATQVEDFYALETVQARYDAEITEQVLTNPLACCDATSIETTDLLASERRAQDRIGELELVCWNPAHRWYYFPEMIREEVLLIKTFDSAKDGRARRSIHTAFSNPLAPPDAPPRESIESRLLVFFD